MSTDFPRPTPVDDPSGDAPKPRVIDLSLTKIVGGALAAMTAAALGSTLSVAGTVIGAAVASVVAAVAGALYTASIQRTRERVRTVFTGRVAGAELPTTVEVVEGAPTPSAQTTEPAPGWVLPEPAASPAVARPRRRLEWKGVVLGALAAFVLAAGCLTLFEVVSGHALSGGKGTTISQVSNGGGAQPAKPATHPTATPTATPSQSAEPTPTPSASTSSTPAASTEPTPSATASTSPTASDAPTATPSASATATPGVGASAPGAAQGQGQPGGATTP